MSTCPPPDCFDDPRVLSLTDGQYRKWVGLCRLAARGRVPGRIPGYPGAGLARALRTQQHHLQRALAVFEALELVEALDGGALWLTLFDASSFEIAPARQSAPEPEVIDDRTPGARRQQRLRDRKAEEDRQRAGEEAREASPVPAQASREAGTVTPATVTRYGQEGVTRNGHHGGNGVTRSVTNGVTPGRSGVTPPRARRNVNDNVSEDQEIIKLSPSERDVPNVAPAVTPDLPGVTPVTLPGVTPPADPPTPRGAAAPEIPPLRRSVPPGHVPRQRREEVGAVVNLTGDDGNRGNWVALWNHCQGAGRLDLWDSALAKLVGRIKGGEEIKSRGALLNTTLRNLLSNAGCPAPVNEALAAGVAAQARQSLATAGGGQEEADANSV